MDIQRNGVAFFCWKLKRLSEGAAKHTTGGEEVKANLYDCVQEGVNSRLCTYAKQKKIFWTTKSQNFYFCTKEAIKLSSYCV